MSTLPSDHDLLLRIDERLMILKAHNDDDHKALKDAIMRQDYTSRIARLEGNLHGSWVVFGGLIAVLGAVIGLFEFLRGGR